jgi:hypothetical protein
VKLGTGADEHAASNARTTLMGKRMVGPTSLAISRDRPLGGDRRLLRRVGQSQAVLSALPEHERAV